MTDKYSVRTDVTIILTTVIPDDRHLVLDLPDDAPTGPAEVRISVPILPPPTESTDEPVNPALEAARAKLRAAGSLSTVWKAPDDAVLLSDEELFKLMEEFAGGPSVDEIMKDIRGEW